MDSGQETAGSDQDAAAGRGQEVVLAVDLGGTTVKGAAYTTAGAHLLECEQPTPAAGEEAVTATVIEVVQRLRSSALERHLTPLAAGIATPGLVEAGTGVVRYASNFRWRDMPLRATVEQAVPLPVTVAHDVAAAGLAESMFGASWQARDSVFIALGTGIAAALESSGNAVRGASGCAGELGHIPVFPAGEACTCGQRGCLEVYASGAGIARRYAARTGQEGMTAEDVAARVSTDPAAAAVWSEAISALSAAIATLTLVLDPHVVVIGGGVAGAGETLLGPLRKAVASLLQWRSAPNIEQSRLGTSAAKIGVAVLAMRAAGHEAWSAAPAVTAPQWAG